MRSDPKNRNRTASYFSALRCFVSGSGLAYIVFDESKSPIIIGEKFPENLFSSFNFKYKKLSKQYLAQAGAIMKTQRPMTTIDFIFSEDLKGRAFKMLKRPLYVNNKIVGVVFEGYSLVQAELALYSAFHFDATHVNENLIITHKEALIILALKFGLNSAQAARMCSISKKAARSRIERIMVKIGSTHREELLCALRSELIIKATSDALYKECFSLVIDCLCD